MQLSVIIVNYNVKHFLEQCLYALCRATRGLESELIVIDNNSSDKSVDYLEPQFPGVMFVRNRENAGFARACNQGLKLAKGKYILFLNPDTIIPEDCLHRVLSFMESKPDAGATGIKMLDGSGKFLKESKRSFPAPLTSLFKLFGLARLFPRSSVFSRYHLGHLDENSDHEVDVLAGAFMLVKKEVLDITGGFDETFFMYGEDVDLSFRIQETPCRVTGKNFRNYYFSGSTIIHFKGESTKRGSMNYVRMFYKAMSVFVRKHYGGTRAGFFIFLIHLGIWIRAVMAGITRFIRRIGLPLIDAALIMLSFWVVKFVWSSYVRPDVLYDARLLWIVIPSFTGLYLLIAYYAGLYDRWYRRSGLVRSTLVATVVLLAAYSLLPEQYRFSRAIILFGALLSLVLIAFMRRILISSQVISGAGNKNEHASTLVIGSPDEFNQVNELMQEAAMEDRIIGRVAVTDNDASAIGHWSGLKELSRSVPFSEVIFCQGVLSYEQIIRGIQAHKGKLKFRIHASGSHSIVGSDSKDSAGESFSRDQRMQLADPYNRRMKRLLDVMISLLALLSFPISLFVVTKPFSFLVNCIAVLFAQKTWVGYATEEKSLPALRKSVISSNGMPKSWKQPLPEQSLHMIDYWYARDYDPLQDLRLIGKSYRMLGG